MKTPKCHADLYGKDLVDIHFLTKRPDYSSFMGEKRRNEFYIKRTHSPQDTLYAKKHYNVKTHGS